MLRSRRQTWSEDHGNLLLPLKVGFILRAIPLANISPTLQHQWLPSSSVHFFLQINVFLPMTWSSSLQSWYSIWSFPVLLLLSQWWCLTWRSPTTFKTCYMGVTRVYGAILALAGKKEAHCWTISLSSGFRTIDDHLAGQSTGKLGGHPCVSVWSYLGYLGKKTTSLEHHRYKLAQMTTFPFAK